MISDAGISELSEYIDRWIMTLDDGQSRVNRCIARTIRRPESTIRLEQTLAGDLGMDSLHWVELSCALEDEFGVAFDMNKVTAALQRLQRSTALTLGDQQWSRVIPGLDTQERESGLFDQATVGSVLRLLAIACRLQRSPSDELFA